MVNIVNLIHSVNINHIKSFPKKKKIIRYNSFNVYSKYKMYLKLEKDSLGVVDGHVIESLSSITFKHDLIAILFIRYLGSNNVELGVAF